MSQPESFKVVVLGDQGTGKTCLVMRYIEGQFSAHQESTIGAFYLAKNVLLKDGRSIKMQLWDTAGQERFRAMAPMYYRKAAAAIICFDITDEDSFTRMKDWVEELRTHQVSSQESLVLAIACNKCDLESQRVVSRARAEQFANKVEALFYETSSKENIGVDELYMAVTEQVIKGRGYLTRVDSQQSYKPSLVLNLDEAPKQRCC